MVKPLTLWITANWKILKEMGIPDQLICLLSNLYVGQKATKQDIEQLTGSKLGREVGGGFMFGNACKNLPQFIVIHTVKGLGIVNKTEIDVFLELSYFWMIQRMLAI